MNKQRNLFKRRPVEMKIIIGGARSLLEVYYT